MRSARRAPKSKRAAAAFYDLDGTLVKTNLVHVLFFQARNQQGILRSVRKTASVFSAVPAFLATDAYSRTAFQELFFKMYKGESEDRIRFLSEELFENVILPSIYPGAYDLIGKVAKSGFKTGRGNRGTRHYRGSSCPSFENRRLDHEPS